MLKEVVTKLIVRQKIFTMRFYSILIVLFCTIIFGCTRDTFDTPPPSAEVLSTLTGSWTLNRVTQKDEGAEIKNSPYVIMDITSLFPYTQYKITLSGTANTPNGTYTAVPGSSPQIIRFNTGKWEVDDAKNPKMISFINGLDTTKMQIGSYPTSFNSSFKLRQTKIDMATGRPAITYDYEFVKQ
jgi:hypothetical protein